MPEPANGSSAAAPAEPYENPLIPNARLKEIYATMVKCRMLEESARSAFNGVGPEAAIGHEATLVSAAVQLTTRDSIASSQIQIAWQLAQKAPVESILREMREAGNASAESAFTAQLKRALDAAKRQRRKKPSPVALAYASGSLAEHESWHEAMRSAVKLALPMVFVWQNDLYDNGKSSSSPQYGFPILTVDGTDALAVYRVVQESTHRARYNGGPTFVECKTYRSSRPSGAAETSYLDARDPIVKLQHQLEAKKLYNAEWAAEIETSFSAELDAALREPAAAHIGPASEHPALETLYAKQK